MGRVFLYESALTFPLRRAYGEAHATLEGLAGSRGDVDRTFGDLLVVAGEWADEEDGPLPPAGCGERCVEQARHGRFSLDVDHLEGLSPAVL